MHTKTPWYLSYSGLSIMSDRIMLASVWDPVKVDETRMEGESWLAMRERILPQIALRDRTALANARLMVAAPDLLAALEGTIRLTEISDVWLPKSWKDDARAAIAKAKGVQS